MTQLHDMAAGFDDFIRVGRTNCDQAWYGAQGREMPDKLMCGRMLKKTERPLSCALPEPGRSRAIRLPSVGSLVEARVRLSSGRETIATSQRSPSSRGAEQLLESLYPRSDMVRRHP